MDYEEFLCKVSDILRAHNKVKGGISSREACERILEAVRPTGEWKQRGRASFGFADFECTNCHYIAEDEPVETFITTCPNCGAKMKGDMK